jgi:hypothetical protein
MPPRKTPQSPEPPAKQEFTISAGMIKWLAGFVGLVLTAVVAWFAVWDRIDTHWRLETVQAARDKDTATQIAAVKDKAEADTKALAKKAEVGRAWLFYGLADGKAYTAAQFARVCKALKLPADDCERQKEDATRFQRDADAAKQTAAATGKD